MSVNTFVGRRAELERLGERLRQVGPSGTMLAVHGRRQCGKSTLVTEFVESSGLPYLYYTALKGGSNTQQMELLAEAATGSHRPLPDVAALFASVPSDWRDALGRISVACQGTRSVIVLDELPWAIEADTTLEGKLKIAWDTALGRSPVLFIVVGSDVATMEAINQHDRPLFGIPRRFHVGPFTPAEVKGLTKSKDPLEVFDGYLVTGGYPGLVTELAQHKSCAAFVKDQLSDPNSTLVTVAQLTLAAELSDAEQARRVLSAIGWNEVGYATFSRIVASISKNGPAAEQATSRALRHLIEAKRLISVDVPVGARPNTKLRRYRVEDSYLRFWFRFVERHLADIARGRTDLATTDYERGWRSWLGKAIEPVVHEAIFRMAVDEPALQGIEKVGSWWVRDGSREYDVVGSDRSGEVRVVGSVKWRRSGVFDRHDRRDLVEARAAVPRAAGAKLLVVCPAGVAKGTDVDLAPTPERLLAVWH